MSAATDTQVALGAGVAQRSLLEWLGRMIDRRDLSLPGPSGDARAAAIVRLLDTFSGEFAAYFEIVESARAAARRNTDSLADVVRSITQQSNHVRATAAAAVEAANATDRVAAAATALGGFAEQAAASAANADGGLAAIGGALGELGSRLDEGKSPLVQMRDSTTGVADFLVTLARLSRNAQLLAVNASIEAAHLDEAGSRFAIVAQEVRKLSVSTRESKADVARIVAELRDSTSQVAAAAKDSGDATMAAGAEIEGAGEALSETGHGIVRFEEMVATIASVAATQGTALQSVSAIVERIAQLADQAVSRSSDAGDLKLDALLERASAKIGRWTLRRQPSSPASLTTDFDRWLASLEAGAAADFRSSAEDDAELKPVCAAIRALIVRVNADQREILVDAIAVAVAVARSASPWNAIGQSLTGVNSEIGTVRATIAESTAGAHTAAGLAGEMRSLVETIRRQYSTALESLDGALARISRITASVRDIDGAVESMNAAAARADSIMALIETLSSETDLLSLNAAIEAAHAGEQGRGFSVIAEEIRSLARSTNDATVSVSELVSNITQISGNLQTSIGAAAACTGEVTSGAESVRSAITILRGAFDSAMQFALEVSTTAADQAVALERVLENINRAASALNPNANPSMERSRLELTLIGSSAHTIAARRSTGSVIEGVRAFGEALCEELEVVFESAIATGRVSHQHLFEFAYAPIAGNDIRSLARLFDVARVPATGFTPEKYATPWDPTIDEALSEVLEKHYDDRPGFTPVTIFVSDLNGFFYAYPRRKIAGWTNDYATDNAGNRIKRIFEDEYALRVGRWGLGPQADNLGSRCGYQTFVQAGCELQRATIRPWGGFVYARDTGMVYNEVALAIYANGMRHSTLRIVYDADLL